MRPPPAPRQPRRHEPEPAPAPRKRATPKAGPAKATSAKPGPAKASRAKAGPAKAGPARATAAQDGSAKGTARPGPAPRTTSTPRTDAPAARRPAVPAGRASAAPRTPAPSRPAGTALATPGARPAPVVPRTPPPSGGRRRGTPIVSTGLAARMAERDAAERHLLRRRVALTLGVVALLAGVAWILLVSPLLALQAEDVDVTVTGTTVDREAVLAAVEPEVGTPLLRVGPAGLVDRLEGITEVKQAQVSRAWPNGLVVTVVAREPVAAASAADGWVLLDAAGVQVGVVSEVPEGLPEVTVPLETSEATAPALEAVLTVLGAMPQDLLAQVAQAGATGPGQVTLVLDDGATVQWGSATENELKSAVLGVLRQQPAAVYDVTVPRTPTTS